MIAAKKRRTYVITSMSLIMCCSLYPRTIPLYRYTQQMRQHACEHWKDVAQA